MTTPKSGDWIGEGSKCKHEEWVEKYHNQCGSPALSVVCHTSCDVWHDQEYICETGKWCFTLLKPTTCTVFN